MPEIPDDGSFESPAAPAPVAVVRRRGESQDGLELRKAGYTDAQLGYGGMRGGASALERSARMALAREREDRQQAADLQAQSNFERKQNLDERKFEADSRVQASRLRDETAANDQATAYLAEEAKLADQYGPYSRKFIEGAIAASRKYPAAVLGSPRIGKQLDHYQDFYVKNLGGNPDLPVALWEVGQFNPSELPPTEAAQYLGEIAGKYPSVANDKAFTSLLSEKTKAVNALATQAAAQASGLSPKQAIVETPGGNVTMTDPNAAKDTVLPSLEKERVLHARMLDRAKRIRAKATDENIIKDADADILESEKALADVESQIRTHRESASGNKPPNTPPTTTAPAPSPDEVPAKLKPLDDSVAAAARAAIAAGKDAEAVKKRLVDSGYDASAL